MRWGIALLGGCAAALVGAPALAQNRSFCAERPGMGTPSCTLAPGEAMLEITALGIDRTADPAAEIDIYTFADTLLRYGLDDGTEIQLGLTGLIDARLRDRASGNEERARHR